MGGRDEAPGPLLRLLHTPMEAGRLSADAWNRTLRQARSLRLAARLGARLQEGGGWERTPPQVRRQLEAALRAADAGARAIRWELCCLRRALEGTASQVVLLKGAAYLAAGLRPARGRLSGDVDLLVPEEDLAAVESALLEKGWRPMKTDPYDQRYYRQYMHELPPLIHRRRRSVVDVHHRILPRLGRVRPDPKLLLQDSQPLPDGFYRILSPADLVLHAAAHLFQDGDPYCALGELLDLHDLCTEFSARDPGFWGVLRARAGRLGLERSLYYSLECARRILDTPIPAPFLRDLARALPVWPLGTGLLAMAERCLRPERLDPAGPWTAVSHLVLYARGHAMRMPLGLLASHLVRKTWRRWTG